MSRTEIQQVVIVILLISFGMVWNISRKGPAESSTPAVVLPAPKMEPSTPAQPEAPAVAPDISRDPFLPPSLLQERIRQREIERDEQARLQNPETGLQRRSTSSSETSNFHLQGVFWGIGEPRAIINRKTVSVGDSIEGAVVTSISKDRVVLEINGSPVALKPVSMRTQRLDE